VDPLVDDARGTLFVPGRKGSIQYTINWREPLVDGLAGAAVDPHAPGGFGGIGEIPPGIAELAAQATGGQRPSFQTALALERFLRDNYRVAAGKDLPTGHGWPQLSQFLLRDKRGTSEQFAASYVALARITGIPARLVVGFRAPRDGNAVVRNGDVLAWPEVAVAGAGWIALDPASGAAVGSASVGLAGATAQARAQLPPSGQVRNPELPTDEAGLDEATSGGWDWLAAAQLVGLGLGMLLAGWLLGVPLTTAVRAWRRRRAPGVKAVLGAWAEARDRLRAHGIPVTVGMTVRDLAVSARTFGSTVDGISALAAAVDAAVWSGTGMTTAMKDQAWAAVRTIRKGLAQRSVSARLRAAIDIRTLIPPR
jgi:protein-glutamine gamma-glutamyltransferase